MSRPALIVGIALLLGIGAVAAWSLRDVWKAPPVDQFRTRPVAQTEGLPATATEARFDSPPRDYVGSQTCRACHADHAASFAGHPMSRSAARVDFSRDPEYHGELSFEPPASSRFVTRLRYEVRPTETGVEHVEEYRHPDGKTVATLAVPVEFAIGSGEGGRSYLTRRGELLFMSPMTWYAQKKEWNFSPGYLMGNLHFERRIVDGCVACHVGQVAEVAGTNDRFTEPVFIEGGIGCERCHGPGATHVRFQETGESAGGKGTDPMLDLKTLSTVQKDALCMQCHLTGEERVLRPGRTDYDFRPGDRLDDIWGIFVKGDGISGGQTSEVTSQPEQMVSSACYQLGEGRLSCLSCHDPHSVPAAEERVAFYRDKCASCHGAGDAECAEPLATRESQAGNSCIACHMPRLPASDVPHTSQTDHRVLRRPSASAKGPVADADNGSDSTGTRLHLYPEPGGTMSEEERRRLVGIATSREAAKSNLPDLAARAAKLLRPWCEQHSHDLSAAEALGTAYWVRQDYRSAIDTLEAALRKAPRREGLLRPLFLIYHEVENYSSAEKVGRVLIELNPYDHEFLGRMAHILGQQGKLDEAIEMARQAVAIRPSQFQIWGWLAESYAARGETAAADDARSRFQWFSPRSPASVDPKGASPAKKGPGTGLKAGAAGAGTTGAGATGGGRDP